MDDVVFIIGQIIGAVGVLINILIYQQKTRIRLLVCKLISDAVWATHFFVLGAYSGFAICAIAIVRELVFMNRVKHKWANHPVWPILFTLVILSSAVLTWKGPISILPAVASTTSLFSFWIGKPKVTRILCFPCSILMIIYDAFVLSYAGITNESLSLLSATIGLIRIDLMHRKHEETVPAIGAAGEKQPAVEGDSSIKK